MMLSGSSCEAVHIGLTGAKISPLHRIVEEPVDRIAVVLVVLRGVDATLGGDRMGAARRIVKSEGLHVVAELGHRGCGCGTRKPSSHHDYVVSPFVGGI